MARKIEISFSMQESAQISTYKLIDTMGLTHIMDVETANAQSFSNAVRDAFVFMLQHAKSNGEIPFKIFSRKGSSPNITSMIIGFKQDSKDDIKKKQNIAAKALFTQLKDFQPDTLPPPGVSIEYSFCHIADSVWNTLNQQTYAKKESGEQKISTLEAQESLLAASNIIQKAVDMGTSDIHILTNADGVCSLHFRINKELVYIDQLTLDAVQKFGNACYTGFNMQEGAAITNSGNYIMSAHSEAEFITTVSNGRKVKGRFTQLYLNRKDCVKIVIRLIDVNTKLKTKTYNELGMSPHIAGLLRHSEQYVRGLIILSGTTNSGKSVTIMNSLMREYESSGGTKVITTIEDPVEQEFPNIAQFRANGQALTDDASNKSENLLMTAEVANKKLTRMDPDIVLNGEIRDELSAMSTHKMIESGQKVYATIHARDPISVFTRLESFNLSLDYSCAPNYIRMIVQQMLVPKVCPHCAVKWSEGAPIPPRYSELSIAKTFFTSSDNKISFELMNECASEAKKTGRSLFRIMQSNGYINSSQVYELQKKMDDFNLSSNTKDMEKRLIRLKNSSGRLASNVNIQFSGSGCQHCIFGKKGISPAAQVLIPDNRILALIKEKNIAMAHLHFRKALGGRSLLEDLYDRILDGIIDPWVAEERTEDLIMGSD